MLLNQMTWKYTQFFHLIYALRQDINFLHLCLLICKIKWIRVGTPFAITHNVMVKINLD